MDMKMSRVESSKKWRNDSQLGFSPVKKRFLSIAALCTAAILLFVSKLSNFTAVKPLLFFTSSKPHDVASFQRCSISRFLKTGLPFLNDAAPITAQEFVQRRDNLARALIADSVDAFVVEPGYTFQYYANISQKDWEVWEPEERPFLMVVKPVVDAHGDVKAATSFLAPSFEVTRAKLLGMPGVEDETQFVAWEEHWNPYATLRKAWGGLTPLNRIEDGHGIRSTKHPKLMVDEEMRDFIQRGLSLNGFEVVGLSGEVEKVRQTKTKVEIEIIRAVNTGTVEAVRAIRECMYPGLSESEVAEVLDNTMRAAGMDPFFDIVLFDENASNPHGGTNGSKVLEAETFVLIDVGAHLFGYSSDICRTFFPPFFPKPVTASEFESLSPRIVEKLSVWDIVLHAQTSSMEQLHEGASAADVDIAAREVISVAGYGDAFTHRVGHGIGIKAHESPYLNKGNNETMLRAGMVFTSEPGIYLVNKFGVRHEDILLVGEDGTPEILTGTRARGPWEP